MDERAVAASVKDRFPDATSGAIKQTIRQKCGNAVKVLKNKTRKVDDSASVPKFPDVPDDL